jgi:hypothetical protein
VRSRQFSNDELRRQLRDFGRESAGTAAAHRRVVSSLLSSGNADDKVATLVGRRDMLRLGGLTVGTAAVIAACSYDAGTPGRVGDAEEGEPPPTVAVDNVVLLRTASSLEYSAIRVYDTVADAGILSGAAADIATRFRADHAQHAAVFEDLAREFGGEPFTCSNPKLDSALIDPVVARITTGAPANGDTPAIEASDDVVLDVLLLAHALENLAGSSYQALVALFSEPALRADAMAIGKVEARHAALLAMSIPGGTVLPLTAEQAEAATTTTAAPATTAQDIASPETSAPAAAEAAAEPRSLPVALPGAFGQLGAYQLIVGRGDVNGVRLKVNLETPSLNSLMYDEISCA